MKLSSLKPYFHFSKSQRKGLLLLFAAIIILQFAYFFSTSKQQNPKRAQAWKWMEAPKKSDSVERKNENLSKKKIYPFNPNFITDYKGYRLGMSVAEIDRLLAFRKKNRYVNSADEFQQVTKVSDSLLARISPYFKFPDWVRQRKSGNHGYGFQKSALKEKLPVIDINLATQEDLKKIYGIGEGLSTRILNEKDKFGAFVSMEQLNDVWGLSPEVVEKLTISFAVKSTPEVKKIQVNDASLKELMQFPYFRYQLAKSIITYRSMNGKIQNPEDLTKISGFPVDKVKIIALYLEF